MLHRQIKYRHCSDTVQSLNRQVQTLYNAPTWHPRAPTWLLGAQTWPRFLDLGAQTWPLKVPTCFLRAPTWPLGAPSWPLRAPRWTPNPSEKRGPFCIVKNRAAQTPTPNRARVGTLFYIAIQKMTPLSRFRRPGRPFRPP